MNKFFEKIHIGHFQEIRFGGVREQKINSTALQQFRFTLYQRQLGRKSIRAENLQRMWIERKHYRRALIIHRLGLKRFQKNAVPRMDAVKVPNRKDRLIDPVKFSKIANNSHEWMVQKEERNATRINLPLCRFATWDFKVK